jgi:hypothetical protein
MKMNTYRNWCFLAQINDKVSKMLDNFTGLLHMEKISRINLIRVKEVFQNGCKTNV